MKLCVMLLPCSPPLPSPFIFPRASSEAITRTIKRRCFCYNLHDQLVPYVDAWKWQKSMVEIRGAAVREGRDVEDAVILLQHPPVYTLGTQSSEEYLLFDRDNPPCDLHRVDRGGEVTYHGPGQLVMYPILNLRNQLKDLHWYLRSLEEIVIRSLWSACAIKARRIKGLTGVWVGDMKVAAIGGIRVSRWITYHGLALNVTTDLSHFRKIVPCGISDKSVGSVREVLRSMGVPEPTEISTGCVDTDILRLDASLLNLLQEKLLDEFAHWFQLDLIHRDQISQDIDAGMYSVDHLNCMT